jgi:hypothetical protein
VNEDNTDNEVLKKESKMQELIEIIDEKKEEIEKISSMN